MTPSCPNTSLPPVVPEVPASAVESLTTRLRGRLDAAVEALSATPVTVEDGTFRVRCGEDAWVTLTPAPSGIVTDAEQAHCTCLLAPRCVHRAAILSICPVATPSTAVDAPERPETSEPAEPERREPSAGQIRAAAGLWSAAAAVLSAGTTGAGAVLQAELLRAGHTARLAGLHRAETAALGVVRCLRDERDPHRAHAPTALVAALGELLLVTHRLKAADPDPALIGDVRHHHRPDGPLRLYGVCREPVIGPGGRGGVVTHLVDDDGRWYTLPDVKPGGPARALRAGTAHVAIRSFLSDHLRLSRGGLILSGAVVAPDGRLLPEKGVRATFAAGRPWPETASAPVSATEPFPAPAAGDPGGSGQTGPLTVRDVEILATDGADLLIRVLPGPGPESGPQGDDSPVRLAPAHRHPALAHTANFRRLGAHPGLRIRVVGRLDPDRVTTLRPLAVAPVPGTEATLRLPEDWRGRADLGYDHLHDGHFPPDLPFPPDPSAAATEDSPLWRVRHLIERAVVGGRRSAAEPARADDIHGHAAVLRRNGFATGADLLVTLGAVAARRTRDAFGRLAEDDQDRYAAQWLTTAVYLAGTEAALRRRSWRG